MSNKTKIILSLLSTSLLLVLYLGITSQPIGEQTENTPNYTQPPISNQGQQDRADREQLSEHYQGEIKALFAECEKLLNQEDVTVEQINTAKNKIMDLKVPPEYKELHLDLVLALGKTESLLAGENREERLAVLQLIGGIKENYAWLN